MGKFLKGLVGLVIGFISLTLTIPLALILGILTNSGIFFYMPILSVIIMIGIPLLFWVILPIFEFFKK